MDSIDTRGSTDDLTLVGASFVEGEQIDKLEERGAQIAAEQDDALQALQTDERGNPTVTELKKRDKPLKTLEKRVKEGKGTEKKLFRDLDAIQDGVKEFLNKYPQFLAEKRLSKDKLAEQLGAFLTELEEFINKLADGLSNKILLDFINKKYPNPIDAGLVMEFLHSVTQDNLKQAVESIQKTLKITDYTQKRDAEVSEVVKTNAEQAAKGVSAEALRIVQGGDLNKLLEHLKGSPLLAPEIFNMLDGPYHDYEKLRAVEAYLIKACGKEMRDQGLKDEEDKSHMTNVWALKNKIQALSNVDIYFAIRNPEPTGEDRNAAAAA